MFMIYEGSCLFRIP